MAQQTATVEDRSTYKANKVSEKLVTDGEDVWMENDEDNRLSTEKLARALDAIENGAEDVSFGDVTVSYAERHVEDRDGWRGEDSERGISLDIYFQSRKRATNMATLRGLLAQDTSVDGVTCENKELVLTQSYANLVTDGTDLWYDGEPENTMTLEQASMALDAIDNGAEEVSFGDTTIKRKNNGSVRFFYDEENRDKRAISTKYLRQFIEMAQ